MYRNISGVKYIQYTSDRSLFLELKKECKLKGIKCRIINGEFFIQSN